jgi:DNA-binding MarR family transcriptional regulator
MDDIRNQVISLISRIDTLSSNFLRNKLIEQGFDGIVSSHGFILHLLTLHSTMTMGEISKLINRDKSTTTALIKKLEKGDFVCKTKSPTDSRIRYIALTKKGIKLTQTTADISSELIKTAYAQFSETEKTQLYTLLKKLESNFECS